MHQTPTFPHRPDPQPQSQPHSQPEPHADPVAEAATEVDISPEACRERRRRQLDRAAEVAAQAIEVVSKMTLGEHVDTAIAERFARADIGQTIERCARVMLRVAAAEARFDKDARAAETEAMKAEAGAAGAVRDDAEGGTVARRAGPRGGAAAERLSPSVEAHRRALKKRARQYLETAIKTSAEPHDYEYFLTELDGRLEDPQVLAELNVKPIGVMVGKLCDELGLKADLSKFTDEELGFAEQMQEALAAHKAMVAKLPKLPTGFVGSPGVPPAEPLPPFIWPPPEGQGDGAGAT